MSIHRGSNYSRCVLVLPMELHGRHTGPNAAAQNNVEDCQDNHAEWTEPEAEEEEDTELRGADLQQLGGVGSGPTFGVENGHFVVCMFPSACQNPSTAY
jgi:hypothetical protein